jgi:glycosyltransferase involved in cell wall biosynthesis
MVETLDGVAVKRCWVYATPNKGFIKKILGHLSFMVSSVVQGGKLAKKADVIVASSPTFFSVISAWWLGVRYRKPYVFEVRDLWPAIFVELGVLKNRFIIWTLERIELFLYRRATAVVPVTKTFGEQITRRGISSNKIHVFTNGVDTTRFSPRPKDESLLQELGLQGKFVVLYIGAHGISHALPRIIDAAEQLKEHPEIHFLFVGEGAEKQKTIDHARELGLTNITFHDGVPKEQMTAYYSIADSVLVPLRDIPLFDTFIPSKMFEIMAMGRPIVAAVRGEAAEILQRSGGALIGEPEQVEQLAKNIRTLSNDLSLCAQLGQCGCEFVRREYDRSDIARRYAQVLATIKESYK